MSIIITILILGIIIFIHELGHFLTAKYFKMPVAEFAIGMGPKIWGFKSGETTYNIRAIPVGGFVNIEGMEIGDTRPDGFNTKKPHERFIVLFAGVFMNFILAWMIMIGMFAAFGEYKTSNSNAIGTVDITSNAYNVLMPGDKIIKIDGKEINKWDEIFKTLEKKQAPAVSLVVDRRGQIISIDSEMKYSAESKRYILGITPETTHQTYNFQQSIVKGSEGFVSLFGLTIKGLQMMFTGQISGKDIAGPIGTVKIVKMFSAWGIQYLIFLTAILSVSVGIFNLIPFPALDGGRILFVIFEMVGIKVNKELEEKIHRVGLIFLFGVMILIMGNDIINLF